MTARAGDKLRAPAARALELSTQQGALLDELVAAVAARNGETAERARRGVEIAVVTRGIAALREGIEAPERPED